MASLWRCCRHCRLRAPSRISNRNRNLFYFLIFFPLLLTFLLIPGGEITNLKYAEKEADDNRHIFVKTFATDDPDGVARETRSLEKKVILLWTAFFESRSWRVTGDAFQGCPVSSCELSVERSMVDRADAVMYSASSLRHNTAFPPHPPWQVWILHNSEPPYHIPLDLRRFTNMFNWTSWYRRDADIFSPYGNYAETGSDDDNDNDYAGNATVYDGEKINKVDSASDQNVYRLHDRLIYIAVSNCRDRGRRYKKIARLKKYLPLDVYGDCGNLPPCDKFDVKCEPIFSRYQFVLAFENGYCRDYVTEKLWNAYKRQQIPVVGGGADYSKFAIPGSYIDYDNFTSVEELALHILQVSTDPDLYNSYFEWRKHYQAVDVPVADWCAICEKLHDKGRAPQVYENLAGWMAQDSCPLFSPYQNFWTHVYLGIFKVFGI